MPSQFVPQPYPLYAVTLQKADEPARFEPADDEPRLVLGWVTDDEGTTLPALVGGSPAGTVWDGPVFYEADLNRAEKLIAQVGKAGRAAVRDEKIQTLLALVEKTVQRR